ncbi:MAG: hypothetical protein ACP5OO_05380 [Chloroflexia bacterium]
MARRVLIVAGREGYAPALQAQIELWGDSLDFTLAASGNEALWEIRGSPYDLVLAPAQLPEMSGMEFAEVVQALSPATRVVLVGVKITPALQSQAEALHLFALLPEVSVQEVASVIGRALDMPVPRPKPPPPPPPPREAPPPAAPPAAPPRRPAAPPPTAPPAPRVTLTPGQQEAVRRALRDLVASIGPQLALLVSVAGEPLLAEGAAGDMPISTLAARMASGLAGAGELARLLKDDKFLGLSLFSGSRYDLYAFTVTPETVLLLVFDKMVVESKLGSVWLYTRRVVEELRTALEGEK